MPLLSPPTVANPPPPVAVTFVLHDAGETKALQPVMRELDYRQVRYSILADATARRLLAGNSHLANTEPSLTPEVATQRQATNPPLKAAMQAPVVVTGLVSPFQRLWASWFARRNESPAFADKPAATVVGYYDSFSYHAKRCPAAAFQGLLAALITPTEALSQRLAIYFPTIPRLALGQPVLETTLATVQNTASAEVLRQQLGLMGQPDPILFAGGYGPGYADALRLYCQTIRRLPQAPLTLLALHPQSNGTLEKQIIAEADAQNSIRLLPASLDTLRVLPLARLVVSHQSSFSVQASVAGKPVFFVGRLPQPDPEALQEQADYEPLQEAGLAQRYESADMLYQALATQLAPDTGEASRKPTETLSVAQRLGYPDNPARRIADFLIKALNY